MRIPGDTLPDTHFQISPKTFWGAVECRCGYPIGKDQRGIEARAYWSTPLDLMIMLSNQLHGSKVRNNKPIHASVPKL